MEAMNRLIYETSQKSKPRTTQFRVIHEGRINMAMSSADERDERDKIKLKRHLKKAEQDGRRFCLLYYCKILPLSCIV